MFTKTGSRVGDRKYNTLQEGEEGRFLAMIFGSDQLAHLPVYGYSPRLTTALLGETGNAFGATPEWKEVGNSDKEPAPLCFL